MKSTYAVLMFFIGAFIMALKERNYKALSWFLVMTVPLWSILGLIYLLACSDGF